MGGQTMPVFKCSLHSKSGISQSANQRVIKSATYYFVTQELRYISTLSLTSNVD